MPASSVDALPEELLVGIFSLYLAQYPHAHSRPRTGLALVCRRWNEVVQNTPSLFAKIHHHDSGARNSLALRRSRSYPLDIFFEDDYYFALSTFTIHNSFKEACECMARWRSAVLRLSTDYLLPCLATPAPGIEKFSIICDTFGHSDVPFDLFAGQAGRLKSLDVYGLPLVWTSKIFTNLRVLKLHGLYNLCHSLTQIVTTLKACPQLSVLTLSKTDFEETLPECLPAVSLSKLEELSLHDIPPPALAWLLEHIDAPPCRILSLEMDIEHWHSNATLIPHVASLIPEGKSGGLELRLWSYCVGLGLWESEDKYCSIDFEEMSMTISTLEHLVPALRPDLLALPTKVVLRDRVYEDADSFYGVMSRLRVTGLEIEHAAPSYDILNDLATANEVIGPRKWPFPQLEDVSVKSNNNTLESLMRMVEVRYALGPELRKESSRLPVPLRSLRVTSAPRDSEHHRQALERTVGAGKVIWEWAVEHEMADIAAY